MLKRRDFLLQTAATSGLLALQSAQTASAIEDATAARKALRILILGGTGFIGPYHVKAAVARGHQVAVFNRGKSEADLPADVERLVGDRTSNLDAIKNRDWDAVLDLAAHVPSWVRSFGEALKGRVKHYTFISTEQVYDISKVHGTVTEDSPVRIYQGPDPYTVTSFVDQYGALKILCEREAEKQFPGKTLVLRPDYIVGPGDPQAYLTYWPVRMEKGGEVLVAGDPSTPVQFIDVRDMAEWGIRMIEKEATGTYNTIGPAEPLTLSQMLSVVSSGASASLKLTWVPSAFLTGQKDAEILGKVTFWTAQNYGGRARLSNARAVANGLKMRPLAVTLADILEWYKEQPVEKQAELLSIWRKKDEGGGYDAVRVPWSAYLQREKEVLDQWRVLRPAINQVERPELFQSDRSYEARCGRDA